VEWITLQIFGYFSAASFAASVYIGLQTQKLKDTSQGQIMFAKSSWS
jgi:hypothetical protein